MKPRIPLLAALLAAMVTTACSTVDYEAAAQRYRDEFNAKNPHKVVLAERKGGKINVREFGEPYRGKHPTIVLMHGFPDSQHLYDPVIQQLAKTRHVVSFDFLGWGDSDKPAQHQHSIESLKTDLQTVVDQLKLTEIVLVVHDLSGQPGIDWALDNEARVAGLVLLNTYYSNMQGLVAPEEIERFSTPGLWRDLSVFGASRADGMWQSGVEAQLSKFFVNAEARRTFVPLFVHQALQIRPAFFAHNRILRDEVTKRDKEVARLSRFKKPVLVAFGASDPYLNQKVAAEFHKLFPSSIEVPVVGGAHYVQLDQPGTVARLIDGVAQSR